MTTFTTKSPNVAAYALMKGAKILKVTRDERDGKGVIHIQGDPKIKQDYKLSQYPQFLVFREYVLDEINNNQNG